MAAGQVRAFLAVPLAPELSPAVTELQKRLDSSGAKVKWVAPENLHFTLKFLGEIPEERVSEVATATHKAVVGSGQFDLDIAGAGAFPHTRRPRTVWVGTREGAEALAALAGAIEDSLAEIGIPRESKSFRPHLTIGRVKGRDFLQTLGELIELEAETEIGRQRVAAACLMKSDLHRSGPVYTTLAEISLGESEA